MTGLTDAERAELRRAAAGGTTNLIIPATWANGLLDALEAAERRTAKVIAAVDAAERVARCDQPHWLDICEHETTEYALVPLAALAPFRGDQQ